MYSVTQYWKPFLLLLGLPILGNIFASELRDLIYWQCGWKSDGGNQLWGTTFVTGGLFVLFALLTILFGKNFFRPRNIALGPLSKPRPHSHIVLFLSNLNTKFGEFIGGVPKGLALTGELEADLAQMARLKELDPKDGGVRWLWEMPLRGLKPHRSTLQRVTLICSKESLLQAHWFAKILADKYGQQFPTLKAENIRLLVRQESSVRLDSCPMSEQGCCGDLERRV